MTNLSPRESVDAVLAASAESTRLYGHGLGMIASENIISPNVKRAINSDLHGRYAEGLPGKRYYQGCDDFDTIESIGIDLAKRVFQKFFAHTIDIRNGIKHWSIEGSCKTRQSDLAVSTADGEHISHARMGAVGLRSECLNVSMGRRSYGTRRRCILLSSVVAKPKIISLVNPFSCFQRPEMADAAHEVDSTVMYDGAHVLGLIAGGVFKTRYECGCDDWFITQNIPFHQGVLHLQARMIHSIDVSTTPCSLVCSSYHLHHVAGKVVALAELEAFGKAYVSILSGTQRSSLNPLQQKALMCSLNHEDTRPRIRFDPSWRD